MADTAIDIPRPGLARNQPVSSRPANIQDPRADALHSFSRDLDAVAGVYAELAKRRQNAEDSRFQDDFELKYAPKVAQIESDTLNGPDSTNPKFVSMLDQKLAQAHTDTLNEVIQERGYNPSQQARDGVDEIGRRYRISTARSAVTEANNQRVSLLVSSAQENATAIAQQAAGNGDLDGGLRRIDELSTSMSGVIAPDKARAFKQGARSNVVEMVVEGHLARKEYDQAQAVVDRYSGFAKPKIDEGPGASYTEQVVIGAAKDQGVDPAVALGMAYVESGMDPQAGNTGSSARGLFQFISSTGQEYGLPGDASTASVQEQARAGAQSIAVTQGRMRTALGTEPTPAELYLGHFLGYGSAMTVLRADADAKVSDLLSPGVIAANPQLRGMTASDLLGWSRRKMQDGMERAGEALDGRKITSDAAGMPINDIISLSHRVASARHDEADNVDALLKDDIASIRATGQQVDIDDKKAADVLPPEKLQKWRDDRIDARSYWENTNDMAGLPQADIETRVTALEPKPGDVGFARQEDLHDDVKKVADKITETRSKDPAASVTEVPIVQDAIKQFDKSSDKRGESWQRLIGARLTAQERVGIVPELRLPLTEAEANQFAAPIKASARNGGDWFGMVDQLAAGFKDSFGQYQDEAFQQVVGKLIGGDDDRRVYASNIIQELLAGQEAPQPDVAKIDTIEDVKRSEEAARFFSGPLFDIAGKYFRGGASSPPPQSSSLPSMPSNPTLAQRQQYWDQFKTPPPMSLPMPVPDEGDIEYLKANQNTLEDFISVFGENAVPEELRGGR